MISDALDDFITDDLFFKMNGFGDSEASVYLKLEGCNPAGSVKLKTAGALIRGLERDARLAKGAHLIESSSGSLGVALAGICANQGYKLTIVTDPNANVSAVTTMSALGAEVVIIRQRDQNGGYLNGRIQYVRRRLAEDPRLIWTNQYASEANADAHAATTAASIHRHFQDLSLLVVGAGTTGTLMGCARFFEAQSPNTRVVGVDVLGSVTFGGPAGKRLLPGLGTSRVPEIYDASAPFERCMVSEADSVAMCRDVARTYGLLVGASTGSALVGALTYLHELKRGDTAVVVSPDLGDRYLETVFSPSWTQQHFPQVAAMAISDST